MNRHPYPDKATGPRTDLDTKAAWSLAVMKVACPKCSSSAGYYCERIPPLKTAGAKRWPPHLARIIALKLIDPNAGKLKHIPHATRGDFLKLCSPTGWYVVKCGQLHREFFHKVLTLPGNCEVFPDVGGGQYADGSTSWIIPVRSPSTRQRVQDIIRCHFSGWFEVRDMTQAEFEEAS